MTRIERMPTELSQDAAVPLRASLALPFGIVVALAVVIGFQPMPRDPDLWFHLASGDYILAHGSVPDRDPFSFTRADELWVPHSWLFDVAVSLAWNHLGPRMAEAIFALIFAAVFIIALGLLVGRGVSPLPAAAICLGLAIAAGNTRGLRPQVLSLLLAAVVIGLLVRHARTANWRTILLLPLIFLFWAQVHAACVMGLIVVAVWLAGRMIDALSGNFANHRRELGMLLASLLLSTLAILVTPHRITHFEYVALTANLETLHHTQEWQPPSLFPVEVPDIYAYLLLTSVVIALARTRRNIRWAELLLAIALLVLSMTAVRHIPLACIAAIPLLAAALGSSNVPRAHVRETLRGHAPPLILLSMLLLAVLWDFPTNVQRRYDAAEPVAGARALSLFDGAWNVFTTYNTGSYVLHAAPGRLRVFVDSRADVYGDEICAAARWAATGKGWEELFERYNIKAAVLEKDDWLAAILRANPDWKLLAEDQSALTFIRADALPAICEANNPMSPTKEPRA
ncbi:MAG: hypothetical protein H6817_09035 [Phycisphaerales bacterium]|nr:hypothetical protein [Phycisphaerales bacterium]